jgi:DinB superfamily
MTQARPALTCALVSGFLIAAAAIAAAQTPPKAPPTPAQSITNNFVRLNQEILAMAQDWPAEKYDFRLDAKANPPVRSFGEVLVHVMSGNVYAAKIGRGEKANWDEIDPKTLQGKAAIVAAFKKSVDDSTAALKAIPPEKFQTTLAPWLSVIEHNAEHYGQLIAYYRANSVVPPSSRPKGSQ